MVRSSANGDWNDSEVLGDPSDIGRQFKPEFIGDDVLPFFGRENAMKVAGTVGVRHVAIFDKRTSPVYTKVEEIGGMVPIRD